MELAVEVRNLTKIFPGGAIAVKNLSFYVYPGEIYGLIGPNGAGKTTTLRIIATLLRPSFGTVKIFGYDVVKEAGKVRKIVSYLPEEAGAYRNLTGYEYLNFMARLYASSRRDAEEMVEEAVRISGLGNRIFDKVKTYSRGMKRRLLLARTLMVRPRLAILDEPTSGLDVVHALHVRRVIEEYAKKYQVTILLSSHNMLEVEHLCNRVGIVYKGSLVAEGPPTELIKMHGAKDLEEVFAKVVKNAEDTYG